MTKLQLISFSNVTLSHYDRLGVTVKKTSQFQQRYLTLYRTKPFADTTEVGQKLYDALYLTTQNVEVCTVCTTYIFE